MTCRLQIHSIPVPLGTWTLVALGTGFSQAFGVLLQNKSDISVRMRSNPDDPATEDQIDAMSQMVIGSAQYPWPAGSSIIWVAPSGEKDALISLRYVIS